MIFPTQNRLRSVVSRNSFNPEDVPDAVLMIGTYNEDGTPNMMNAAWGGVTLEDQITVASSTAPSRNPH